MQVGGVILYLNTLFDSSQNFIVNQFLQNIVPSISGIVSSDIKNRAILIANARGNTTAANIMQNL